MLYTIVRTKACARDNISLPQPLRRLLTGESAPLLLDDEESRKLHGRRRWWAFSCRPGLLLLLPAAACLLVTPWLLAQLPSMEQASHRQTAFLMSLGAGMSTGIGACFVLCISSINPTLLAGVMSFSSGVMIYVSLVEVIGVANEYLARAHPPAEAYALATLSFFVGVSIMAFVDMCVHRLFRASRRAAAARASPASAEEAVDLCEGEAGEGGGEGGGEDGEMDEEGGAIRAVARIPAHQRERMLLMAAVVAVAIVLHNIPEGMATYVASFHSVSSGLPLAMAIAIHNVPEGLAVAMPVLYGTGSKAKAIGLGTLSGLAEPFGAFLASLVANENSSQGVFGGVFGATAGMMTYVCIEELLPSAYAEKGVPRWALTASFFGGCAVMALSLVIEKLASAG